MRHPQIDLPNILQRDPEFLEAIDNALEYGPIFISPSTLVISECEVLLHNRETSSTQLIRFGDLLLSGPSVEIQLNATTKCSPRDIRWSHQNFLPV